MVLLPKQGKLCTVSLMDWAGTNAKAVQNEVNNFDVMKSDGVRIGVLESAVETVEELSSGFTRGYAHRAYFCLQLVANGWVRRYTVLLQF